LSEGGDREDLPRMKEICQACQNGRRSPELKAKSPFPWQQRSRSLTLRTSARQKLTGSMVVLRFGMACREGGGLEERPDAARRGHIFRILRLRHFLSLLVVAPYGACALAIPTQSNHHLERTPCISMAKDAFSGSFDSTSLLCRAVPLRMTAECGYVGYPHVLLVLAKRGTSELESKSNSKFGVELGRIPLSLSCAVHSIRSSKIARDRKS
jgi:hypothetical protein